MGVVAERVGRRGWARDSLEEKALKEKDLTEKALKENCIIKEKCLKESCIKRVGFWLNEDKPEGEGLAREAAAACREAGIVVSNAKAAAQAPAAERPQLAVVFGGDGTMIAAARALAVLEIPLVGVNMGRLGFLMSLEAEDMPQALLRLIAGEYVAERRLQLEGRLLRGGREAALGIAQNDIVVNNGSVSRMIGLELYVDGHPALEMKGDGLVVATPTGSTAYSLSAGGSIVLPETEVILVTPVAAHSLYSRPMVVSGASQLSLRLGSLSGGAARLTFDGQYDFEMGPGDELLIQRHEPGAVFFWPEPGMFLKRLKSKLMSKG